MAPATPAPRMRSLLAALTMASTSMSVMSPNWMRMRSVRRGMEGIVEQLRGDRWSDGRLIGISEIRRRVFSRADELAERIYRKSGGKGAATLQSSQGVFIWGACDRRLRQSRREFGSHESEAGGELG